MRRSWRIVSPIGVKQRRASPLRTMLSGPRAPLSLMRRNRGPETNEQLRLEKQVETLLAERDIIRAKVEAMLDAVAALDPEMAEELR